MSRDVRTMKLLKYPVVVEVLARYADEKNPLKIVLVDQKKHWEGVCRKGVVVNIADWVKDIQLGDIVFFKATAGFTLDADPSDPEAKDESRYRFLKLSECLMVDARQTQEVA